MKKTLSFILLLCCFYNLGFAQGRFVVLNTKKTDKIRFKLINNLIVIPVEVNGVELSFLLDTGVSKTILFNYLEISDDLKIKDTDPIYIRGLGEGESVEALKSKNNVFKIGDAINLHQDLFAVFNENIDFAPRLGIPVHGIIGYDLFRDFVIEINYSRKFIRLTEPHEFKYKKCKKCETLNLEFYHNKPYINATVKVENKNIPIKLLIDSGGSDALWLFEDISSGIIINNTYFEDFLGHGLSGSVYGKRSKIDEFALNSFVLKNANVAYPDSTSISIAKEFKDRNGSLAGNILKRFNHIVDYQHAKITIKKNNYFKEPFNYNKSGIELANYGVRLVKEEVKGISNTKNSIVSEDQQNEIIIVVGTRYKMALKPAYSIVELREASPAQRAGLQIGDVILTINNKQTYQYSLQQLMHNFYEDAGKKIRIKIDRDGQILNFEFILENLLD
ncbi:aspartyl protease family protein [Yeosuana sp.]|uniref:aspartyl protease family protein n=1 Tax=Yeosuana sp. TaxID=2529388 RepID=UPI00405510D6|tara:strand:+ start:3820 stop:5160 length:1341 start_codon:yes stop_codon:yes gene_type:complete